MRIRERQDPDLIEVAETRFALARTLWQSGGDRSRARTLASEARAAYAAKPLFATQERAIDAWLAERAAVAPSPTPTPTKFGGRHSAAHASK